MQPANLGVLFLFFSFLSFQTAETAVSKCAIGHWPGAKEEDEDEDEEVITAHEPRSIPTPAAQH